MDVTEIFFLMNKIVGCKKPIKLIDETKRSIEDNPNQTDKIVENFKKTIDIWFKKIMIKSIFILVVLIIVVLCLIYFKHYAYLWILGIGVLYALVYIIDKHQREYEIKINFYDEIEGYAFRYGIHNEQVYGF